MNETKRNDAKAWLAPAAVGAAALLVGVVAFLFFVKHATYPIPAVRVGAPPAGYQDVFWPVDDGIELHGWHGGSADPARPVMLFFHGNGENLETMKWTRLFERMAELDVYAVAVDYPGYGRSGGSPSEAGLIGGGIAAFDWASERWPERPVIVTGWSLGAAVAIQVAAERPDRVDGLILMSGWSRIFDVAAAHFPAFLVRLMLRESYDSIAAASRVRCPSLVIHGGRDGTIPASQGESLAAALAPRSRWLVIADAGHNDLLGRSEVWTRWRAFADSVAR